MIRNLRWMFPTKNLDYLTEDSSARFSGLDPVHNREDCCQVLDGDLDIRAQGGTFALCRLSTSIKQHAAFFFFFFLNHIQKASQV